MSLPRYVRPYRASTDAGPVVVVSHTWNEARAALEATGHRVDALRGDPGSRWTNVLASPHMRHVALKAI